MESTHNRARQRVKATQKVDSYDYIVPSFRF